MGFNSSHSLRNLKPEHFQTTKKKKKTQYKMIYVYKDSETSHLTKTNQQKVGNTETERQ